MHLVVAALLACALADDPAYREGVDAYKQSDFETAQAHFATVLTSPSLTEAEKATVTLWLALAAAGLNDAHTDELFARAVDLDVTVALPVKTAPATAARLERARAVAAAKAHEEKAALAPPENPERRPPAIAQTQPERPAKPKHPEDGPPPDAPPPAETGPPLPWILGGAGAVGLAGSAGLGVATAVQMGQANDTSRFADERASSVQGANASLVGAVAAGVVGAALVGTAIYFGM